MAYKGRFKPKNISKYAGDFLNVTFRSLWELQVMKYLDENESVVAWASEEHPIPYISPLDGRYHRYFVDFWLRVRKPDGTLREYLWEVKPHKESVQPFLQEEASKAAKRRYAGAVQKYVVNQAKWKAARELCEEKGWTFHVITEKQLSVFIGQKSFSK